MRKYSISITSIDSNVYGSLDMHPELYSLDECVDFVKSYLRKHNLDKSFEIYIMKDFGNYSVHLIPINNISEEDYDGVQEVDEIWLTLQIYESIEDNEWYLYYSKKLKSIFS